MKIPLRSLAASMFSEGEKSAMRALLREFGISRNHRNGLAGIKRNSWSRPDKLNLGCGSHRKAGFLNVDMFPGGDLTLDIRRGLPFESSCCKMIFSEHCFEHVDYPDTIARLLHECLRVLEPGGLLRFSVPDTEWPLSEYAKGPGAEYFRLCKKMDWHHPDYCATRLDHINYHFRQYGEHLFAYDEETARKLLNDVGFVDIQREEFDPSIDSRHREIGSLFMSARKVSGHGP